MNGSIKRRWVSALRSGRYKQGRGVLWNPSDNTFCCLGVLCEIAREDGIVERDPSGAGYGNPGADVFTLSIPPIEVAEWAGLMESNPIVWGADLNPNHPGATDLTYINDQMKLDFRAIARIIEEQL